MRYRLADVDSVIAYRLCLHSLMNWAELEAQIHVEEASRQVLPWNKWYSRGAAHAFRKLHANVQKRLGEVNPNYEIVD
jgi:hypothetical protein